MQILHIFLYNYKKMLRNFLLLFNIMTYEIFYLGYTGCGSITSFFEMRAIQWDDVVAER